MTTIKRTYISDTQPAVAEGIWLKPANGGFAAYVIMSGRAVPLEIVDDNDTPAVTADDVANSVKSIKSKLIGSVQDKKTANTINGAKAYADDQAATLLGTAQDAATDMTLYGLKAYIDSKVPAAETT